MVAWLKPPDTDDPRWYVKRWMAVTCIKLMMLSTIWVLGLMSYVVISGAKINSLSDFSAILMIFVPSLASVVIKYFHDESKVDVAKLSSKEPE